MAATKHLHIDAMTTATPARVTDSAGSRRISVAGATGRRRDAAFQSRFRLVLYYEEAEEPAAVVAGWLKESLSCAILEQPLLAGRLRRDDGGGGWWVKFSDTGVRMVMASADATLAEFLEDGGGEDMAAYWVDIDVESPDLSALFFVQVTEFQGGGYSVGISCSLLLADPVFLIRFLRSWSLVHAKMLAQGQLSDNPIFNFRRFNHLKSTPLFSSPATATATATVLFKVPPASDGCSDLASHFLEAAAARLGTAAAASKFTVLANDTGSSNLTVEFREKEGVAGHGQQPNGASTRELVNVVQWEELGTDELVFGRGKNKPVRVSCSIVYGGSDGLVVVAPLPPPGGRDGGVSELLMSVTVAK